MSDPHRGFFRQIGRTSGAFGADMARFVALRIELAALEGREARVAAIRALLLVAIAAGMLTWAALFASAAAVAWIADRFDLDWWWVAFGAAGVHVVVGLALLAGVRSRSRRGYFTETVQQFRRDREWLDAHGSTSDDPPSSTGS